MAFIGRTLRSQVARTGLAGLGSGLLLSLLVAMHGSEVAAQTVDVANPAHFQCVGKNRYSGVPVVPSESDGDALGVAYSAILFDSSSGKPLIVYGSRFRNMAPLMQSFIKRHECQHANGVQDEIEANCAALLQMRALGLTVLQEARIAEWHNAEGTLDPPYGGSGTIFWERTMRCAGGRTTRLRPG